MDLALYVAVILIYACGLVWFSLRISRRKRRRVEAPEGIDPTAAERGDLIDPTSLFRYREEEAHVDALLSGGAPARERRPARDPLAGIDLPDEGDGEAQAVRDLLLEADRSAASAARENLRQGKAPEPAPAPERTAGEARESERAVEEFVIETLLQDSFGALLEFLKGADDAACAANLPRLFEFRSDERFVFAVSEMLSHRSPQVQETCRALVERLGDPALLDELVDLSMNQSFLETAGATADPEWTGLTREEKIARLERETDPDRALALAGALAGESDPHALAVVKSVAERLLAPAADGRSLRRRAAAIPSGAGGVAQLRTRLALARIGVPFRVTQGDTLLRGRSEDYDRHNLADDLYDAVREGNEFVRGKALLRMGRTLLTARALLSMRDRLADGSAHVRACAAEALALFARRARDRALLQGTREIRQMLLSALLAERDGEASRRIEDALYEIERAPGMPDLAPLQALPEKMPTRYAMKRLPHDERKQLEKAS